MDTLNTFINQLWHLMKELSPWLLFGLLLAGILLTSAAILGRQIWSDQRQLHQKADE